MNKRERQRERSRERAAAVKRGRLELLRELLRVARQGAGGAELRRAST